MPGSETLAPRLLVSSLVILGSCTQEPAQTLPDMIPSSQMNRAPVEARAEPARLRPWPAFPAMLWFDARAAPASELLAALRELGIDGAHVNGADMPRSIVDAGLAFYTGDASGKGFLHLREADFNAAAEASSANPKTGPVRPHCFNEAAVFSQMQKNLADVLGRHLPFRPLGIALEDEISTTHGIDPVDFCYCETCLRSLRAFLRKRYRSVDALRAAWDRPFVSFDNAIPERTGDALARNKDLPLEKMSFTSWSDHREFIDRSLTAVVRALIETVHASDASVPVGVLGGRPPSAFGGAVWSELAPLCTFLEVYSTANANELARSYAPADCRFVSTLFLKGSDPRKLRRDVLGALAHGDDGMIIFSHKEFVDHDHPTALALALRAPLELVRRVRESLGVVRRDRGAIAILDSQESIRAGWLVDASQDGDTFAKRLTSYEVTHSAATLSRTGWMRFLEDLRLPYHFLSADDLRRGGLRSDAPRVVILSRALALSDREVRELTSFVERGGLLIADSHLAMFDEQLRGRAVPALDEFFSVSRDARPKTFNELSQHSDVAAEFGLSLGERGVEELGPSSRQCAILRKLTGTGCTLYLNLDLASYKTANPRSGRLRDLLKIWFKERGIVSQPAIDVEGGTSAPRVTAYHYLQAASARIVMVVADEDRAEPIRVRVRFADTTPIQELVSQTEPPAAQQYTFDLAADSALVIKYSAPSQ